METIDRSTIFFSVLSDRINHGDRGDHVETSLNKDSNLVNIFLIISERCSSVYFSHLKNEQRKYLCRGQE